MHANENFIFIQAQVYTNWTILVYWSNRIKSNSGAYFEITNIEGIHVMRQWWNFFVNWSKFNKRTRKNNKSTPDEETHNCQSPIPMNERTLDMVSESKLIIFVLFHYSQLLGSKKLEWLRIKMPNALQSLHNCSDEENK